MDDYRLGAMPLVAVALLLAITGYVGAYFALVDRREHLHMCSDGKCRPRLYHYGGQSAERIFAPARWVDKRMRPDEEE